MGSTLVDIPQHSCVFCVKTDGFCHFSINYYRRFKELKVKITAFSSCLRIFGEYSYVSQVAKKILFFRYIEIRSKFLPKEMNSEKSEQRYLMKIFDTHDLIDQARLTGQDKILRDMLMLLSWEQGAFKNEEIGNAMGTSQ